MAQAPKQTQPTNRAEEIRKKSEAAQQKVIQAFQEASSAESADKLSKFMHAFGLAIVWGVSYLPEIAAELAEANSRDREAEIRAKNAEEFVEGFKAEFAKLQGSNLVVPTIQVPGPKR